MKTKKFGLSMPLGISLVLGLGCIGVGTAFASETNYLQPASAVTYNEDLTVNGTGSFDSIKIGKQGVGGVTFFNGSILNATTGKNNYNNPVTFADHVRIDGYVFRGERPGIADKMPFYINDNLYVQGVITGDGMVKIDDKLEVTKSANFLGTVKIENLQGSGIVKEDNIANGAVTYKKLANNIIDSAKIVDGTVMNNDLAGNIAPAKIAGTALIKSTTFGGDVAGTYNNLQLGASVVGTGEIASGAVTSSKMKPTYASDVNSNEAPYRRTASNKISGLMDAVLHTVTINVAVNSVLDIRFSGELARYNTNGGTGITRIYVDGAYVPGTQRWDLTNNIAGNYHTVSSSALYTVMGPGPHTVEVRWTNAGGNGTTDQYEAANSRLDVMAFSQ